MIPSLESITGRWDQTKPPVGYELDRSATINTGSVARLLWNEGAGRVLRDIARNRIATITGLGGSTWTPGRFGPALTFDNSLGDSTDVVVLQDDPAFDGGSALTIAIWAKQTTLGTNQGIVSKWDYQTQGSWALQTSATNTKLQFFVANALNDTGGNNVTMTNANWTTGWHHVCVTYNAGTCAIYIDGVSQALTVAGTIPATMQNSSATVKIGKFGGTLTRNWVGSLDGFTLFNRPLLPSEVVRLYAFPFDGVQTPRRRIFSGAVVAAGGSVGHRTIGGWGGRVIGS